MDCTLLVLGLLTISVSQSLAAFEVNITSWQETRWKRQSDGAMKCILPPYPDHGVYSVEGAPHARPGDSYKAMQLTVSCHPGYRPKSHSMVYCVTGTWSEEMPECVRHCRLDTHPSVRYLCSVSSNGLDEGFRDCNEYEPTGTAVKPQCNQPNYYYNGVKTLMRCINGRWDHIVICTADCGRVTPEGMPLIIGGQRAYRGEFPWHAGIYLKPTVQGEIYRQICGGSIISTKVIISAAHCFWSRGQVRPASTIAVAVGKLNRDWNNPSDDKAQKFDVEDIKIPVRYRDEATNYQDDIAAVTLSAEIVYQPHVRPVCIDFDPVFDRTQLKPGAIGKVAGWGYMEKAGKPSPVLKVLDMPYVKVAQCIEESPQTFRQFITSDKICAGYLNGSAVCRGDSGGGLVFPAMDRGVERYYLRGIVSTAPKSDNDECNSYARASFTQILVHSTFIEENTVLFEGQVNTQQDALSFPACVLPPYPRNGNYTVAGIPIAFPGQIFLSAQLEIVCNKDYIPEKNVSPSCSYGRWSDSLPDCVRQCTLPEDNATYRCSRPNGEEYDCSQHEPSGVTARLLCGGEPSEPVHCVNGEWSDKFACGPTARCMKGDVSSYLVAAGVKDPSWLNSPEREYRQSSEVVKIDIHPNFVNNAFDIAVVHLSKPFEFNPRVQPICLDLNFKYMPRSLTGVTGLTASWGNYSAGSTGSAALATVHVRYIGLNNCAGSLDSQRREAYLSFDHICVRITSGQPCRGEPGLGFVIPVKIKGAMRYVLRGIFSTNFQRGNCDLGSPLGMVDVGQYLDFVRYNKIVCGDCDYEYSDLSL